MRPLDQPSAGRNLSAVRAMQVSAIARLAEVGVLVEITGGGRNRIWVGSDGMTELRTLEERIGVRSKPSSRRR